MGWQRLAFGLGRCFRFGWSQGLDAAVVPVWHPVENLCHADKRGPAPRHHPHLGEGVHIRPALYLRFLSD